MLNNIKSGHGYSKYCEGSTKMNEFWETAYGEIIQHKFSITVVITATNNMQKEAISSEVIFFILKVLYSTLYCSSQGTFYVKE